MWLFSGKKQRGEPEDTTERLERIEKALRRLEEDWSEVYGKFRTLQMRVAKQVQRLDQASEEEGAAASDETISAVGTGASSLSPRALKIQQQILERRNRLQKGATE
jgi:predicted nuclease with TOPRIM domain